MKKKALSVAVVIVAAVAVGIVGAALASRNQPQAGDDLGFDTTLPEPVAGSGVLVTDAPSPTPVLPTIPPVTATPSQFVGEAAPAPWIEGRYRVLFRMKADSCGERVSPQEHDLVVTRLEGKIRVEDTYTRSILEGPASPDGSFRVESSTPLVQASRRALRQVMTGKASPDSISGEYFVYPPIKDCAVQLSFEGTRVF